MAAKTKWEHKAIKFVDPMEVALLDSCGADGWELVCVFCQRNEVAIAYFRREVK